VNGEFVQLQRGAGAASVVAAEIVGALHTAPEAWISPKIQCG
jgi:hypothetical protein